MVDWLDTWRGRPAWGRLNTWNDDEELTDLEEGDRRIELSELLYLPNILTTYIDRGY